MICRRCVSPGAEHAISRLPVPGLEFTGPYEPIVFQLSNFGGMGAHSREAVHPIKSAVSADNGRPFDRSFNGAARAGIADVVGSAGNIDPGDVVRQWRED